VTPTTTARRPAAKKATKKAAAPKGNGVQTTAQRRRTEREIARLRKAAAPAEPATRASDATDPRDMREAYLLCHAEQHWWDKRGDTNILRGPGGKVVEFTRNHVCMRCGETRAVKRTGDFAIVGRAYVQPVGFRMLRDDEGKGESHRWTALRELLRREGYEI